MAVYGYARVSTVEQAEGGHSLETQRSTLGGFAQSEGMTIDRCFIDRGVSGSKPLGEGSRGERSEECSRERGRGSWATSVVLGWAKTEHHKNQLKAAPRRIGRNMILTQCAVCATELGLTLGKKCGRCSTPQGRGQVLGLHAC